jgi:hypothetical protein
MSLKGDSGIVGVLAQPGDAPGFLPSAEPGHTLAGNVQDRTLLNPMAAVFPTERDVHLDVENPKCLSAFGRTPDDGDADARQDAVDEVLGGRSRA